MNHENPPGSVPGRGYTTVDYDELLYRMMDRSDLVDKMLRIFAEHVEGYARDVHDAVHAQDPQMVRDMGHRLKGAAATAAAEGIRREAEHMEASGRDGNLALAAGRLEALQDEVARFVADYRRVQGTGPSDERACA